MPAHPRIPAATRVHESRVIPAPYERVWEAVRPLKFAWLQTVKEVQVQEGKEGEVGSHRRVSFKDGTVQTYKLVELSDLDHFVTYDVITSEPAVAVSSAIHTIKVVKITHDNTTLIQWTSDFSNDATQEVIQDSKYKKQEAFENLVAFLKQKRPADASRSPSPKRVK